MSQGPGPTNGRCFSSHRRPLSESPASGFGHLSKPAGAPPPRRCLRASYAPRATAAPALPKPAPGRRRPLLCFWDLKVVLGLLFCSGPLKPNTGKDKRRSHCHYCCCTRHCPCGMVEVHIRFSPLRPMHSSGGAGTATLELYQVEILTAEFCQLERSC